MEDSAKISKNWGGSRQGAGRKSIGGSPRVTIAFTADQSVKERIVAKAKEEGLSASQLLCNIVESWFASL